MEGEDYDPSEAPPATPVSSTAQIVAAIDRNTACLVEIAALIREAADERRATNAVVIARLDELRATAQNIGKPPWAQKK